MRALGEAALSSQEATAWYDVIGKFRVLAAQFEAAHRDLSTRPIPDDPALAEEQARLRARAETVATTVRGIASTLNDVMSALSGAWDKVTGAWDWVSQNVGLNGPPSQQSLQGLGLPIIPIAVVVAAIAVITAFLADYAQFTRKASIYEAERARGASPEQASNAVERIGGVGIVTNLASTGKTFAVTAAVLAGLYIALRATKGNNRG